MFRTRVKCKQKSLNRRGQVPYINIQGGHTETADFKYRFFSNCNYVIRILAKYYYLEDNALFGEHRVRFRNRFTKITTVTVVTVVPAFVFFVLLIFLSHILKTDYSPQKLVLKFQIWPRF